MRSLLLYVGFCIFTYWNSVYTTPAPTTTDSAPVNNSDGSVSIVTTYTATNFVLKNFTVSADHRTNTTVTYDGTTATPTESNIVKIENVYTNEAGKIVDSSEEDIFYTNGNVTTVIYVEQTYEDGAVVKTSNSTYNLNGNNPTPQFSDVSSVVTLVTNGNDKTVSLNVENITYTNAGNVQQILDVTNFYDLTAQTVDKTVKTNTTYNGNNPNPDDADRVTIETITYNVDGNALSVSLVTPSANTNVTTVYTPSDPNPANEKKTLEIFETLGYEQSKVVNDTVIMKTYDADVALTETNTSIILYNGVSPRPDDANIVSVDTKTADINGHIILEVYLNYTASPYTITSTKFDADGYVVSVEVVTPGAGTNETTVYKPSSSNPAIEHVITHILETIGYNVTDPTKVVNVTRIIQTYDVNGVLTQTEEAIIEYSGVSTKPRDEDIQTVTTSTYNPSGNLLSVAVTTYTYDNTGALSQTSTTTTSYNGTSPVASEQTKTSTSTVVKAATTTAAPVTTKASTTTAAPSTTTAAPSTTTAAPVTTAKPKKSAANIVETSTVVLATSLLFSLIAMAF